MARKRVWVTCEATELSVESWSKPGPLKMFRFWAREPIVWYGSGRNTHYAGRVAHNQKPDEPIRIHSGECVVNPTVERLLVGLNLRRGQCKEVKLVEVNR